MPLGRPQVTIVDARTDTAMLRRIFWTRKEDLPFWDKWFWSGMAIGAFTGAVVKAKPSGSKGTFVQRVAISSTMGPGVKIDPASVQEAG